MTTEHWIAGEEHDAVLFEKLGRTLRKLGYSLKCEWAGVAWSQEVSHWEFTRDSGSIIVEAETYIGLIVSGESELVSEVKAFFR